MCLNHFILNTRAILLLLLVLLVALSPMASHARAMSRISILADPSLSPALAELSRRFVARHSVSASVEFATTSVLGAGDLGAAQDAKEEVVDVDVLITSRHSVVESLKLRGMVDIYSESNIIGDSLCLATYASNSLKLILIPRLPLASILRKLDPEFYFVLGDPEYQHSGSFALQALQEYDMLGDLEPHFLFMRTSSDMESELGEEGAYGVTFCSQAENSVSMGVRGVFSDDAHASIIYRAVAVAGEHMEEAREFISYLQTTEAQKLLKDYHYRPLTEEEKLKPPMASSAQ